MEMHRNQQAVEALIQRNTAEGKVRYHPDFEEDRSMMLYFEPQL